MNDAATTPMPLPTSSADAPAFIVIFGGTFDPPHVGHVELPRRVRDELERREGLPGRGWIVYVPASRSPHKPGAPIASEEDRVAMLRLALEGVERAAVWTDEIDRARAASTNAESSYSVHTLRRARAWLDDHGMSGVPLRLLIGADQALSFHRWRDPRDILRLAAPVVMVRNGAGADARTLGDGLALSEFWRADEIETWKNCVVRMARMDVSSTQTREALSKGDWEKAARWLHPKVIAWIRAGGIYSRSGT